MTNHFYQLCSSGLNLQTQLISISPSFFIFLLVDK